MREKIEAYDIRFIHLGDYGCDVSEVRKLEADYEELQNKLKIAVDQIESMKCCWNCDRVFNQKNDICFNCDLGFENNWKPKEK